MNVCVFVNPSVISDFPVRGISFPGYVIISNTGQFWPKGLFKNESYLWCLWFVTSIDHRHWLLARQTVSVLEATQTATNDNRRPQLYLSSLFDSSLYLRVIKPCTRMMFGSNENNDTNSNSKCKQLLFDRLHVGIHRTKIIWLLHINPFLLFFNMLTSAYYICQIS